MTGSESETTFGRYRLLGLLGRGGMGQVFRAYDTETDRVVAIKVLPPHLVEDREFEHRFRREARTAAALNDPHIVPIHSFGEIDGRLYVDMRLIEGRDLGAFIAENGGRLDPATAVAIVEQVAGALDSAHQVGLVHRDVKPSNILVANARNFVYLIDFGIARATTDTAITTTGHTMGTLAYMAPERFRGNTDPRADVYSLACVLYECLTGRRPYPGDSLEEQISAHLNNPPPRPSTTTAGIPPAFDEVIARGMAKDPQLRYQSVHELAEAARAALTNTALPNPHAPSPPAPAPPHASNWSIWVGVAAAAALILVVAVVAVYVLRDHKTSNNTASPAPSSARVTDVPGTAQAEPKVPALPAFSPPANVGANCQYPPSTDAAARPVKPPRTGRVPTDPAEVGVTMTTNQGAIGLQLANNKAPCTVNSFVSLAQQGFFDDTGCHRLTAAQTLSVLQCGDPKGDGTGGPGYEFANEYPTNQFAARDRALTQPMLYPRGTIAMANAGPDTNGSQFFLVYDDSELPPQYTVFGTMDEAGTAVVEKIAKGGIVGGGEDGTPATAVTIASVRLD
ncbi:hypothetical protein MKUB_19570 [Mycobacterium kubicae]|uniref:non-specific serine/threonine protein kinase n=2 Tax=Mycobacterium kubicae TaxID=120959 RepID=A0ABQ1BL59_9MYCO|nr:protein kinase [Mycobacterium kubicae]ORW04195.1 protein kinase [Mycobacterium kubicae]GFG64467.1 hypothetical protein MKUB_19570 [Mycobacterium kubicae]